MLRRIRVDCTQCHSSYELLLGNDAPVLVLNCPSCGTSLMHADGTTFGLAQTDAEALCRGEPRGLVAEILRRLVCSSARGAFSGAARPLCLPPPAEKGLCASAQMCLREPHVIDRDDVLDLRIELELCRDSAQFLERIS
jgi:hypothetical protein